MYSGNYSVPRMSVIILCVKQSNLTERKIINNLKNKKTNKPKKNMLNNLLDLQILYFTFIVFIHFYILYILFYFFSQDETMLQAVFPTGGM